MLHTVEAMVVLIGLGASALSFAMGLYFWQIPAAFGKALALMCWAETITGVCTLALAGSTALGIYGDLAPWIVLVLRALIFVSLSGSTLHLYRVLRRVQNG